MRLGGCRTGVRRGPMQGVATDVAACASVPRLSFFFFFWDLHRLGSDSRQTGPIRPELSRTSQRLKLTETAEKYQNWP